jgi:hypothetical protein
MDISEQDRREIIAAITAITRGADERSWDSVRAVFAPQVTLDYGSPELLTPEQIVARWRPMFAEFDRTRHEISEAVVELPEKNRARVASSFVATHHLPGATGGEDWTLSGRYEHELVRSEAGWRVSRMRMIPGQSTGNATLPEQALARARSR